MLENSLIKCSLCPSLKTKFNAVELAEHVTSKHVDDCNYIKCGQCDFKTFFWRDICVHAVDTKHKIGSLTFDLAKFVNRSFGLRDIFSKLLDGDESLEEEDENDENLLPDNDTGQISDEDLLPDEDTGQICDKDLDQISLDENQSVDVANDEPVNNVVTDDRSTVNDNDIESLDVELISVTITAADYCEQQLVDDDVLFIESIPPPAQLMELRSSSFDIGKKRNAVSVAAARSSKRNRRDFVEIPEDISIFFDDDEEINEELANEIFAEISANPSFPEVMAPPPQETAPVVEKSKTSKTSSKKKVEEKNGKVPSEENVVEEKKVISFRWYTCSFCDNCFRPYDLIKHAETHWGPRLWICQLCDFKGVDKLSVKTHIQNEHSSVKNKRLTTPKLQIGQDVFEKILILKTQECFPKWKKLYNSPYIF